MIVKGSWESKNDLTEAGSIMDTLRTIKNMQHKDNITEGKRHIDRISKSLL